MKLPEVRDAYYGHSGKLSDVSRQLALGGLAIVWIFKTESPAPGVPFSVPDALVEPALWLMIGLTLDLGQYLSQSLLWWLYNAWMERKLNRQKEADKKALKEIVANYVNEQEFDTPGWINVVPLVFFWGKIVMMCVGYYYLLAFLGHAVKHKVGSP